MPSTFNTFLTREASSNAILPALPLTHGTTAYKLRKILQDEKLSVSFEACETLGEKLLFTFYGRPAYKVSPGNTPLRQGVSAACYIILNPNLLEHCFIMHALDTGAFTADLLNQEVDEDLKFSNFELDPSITRASDLIKYYFGNNEAYYDCSSKIGLSIDQFDFEAFAYYALLNSRNTNAIIDERNSTIEVAFDKDIPLSDKTVLGILIPDTFSQHSTFQKWNETGEIKIATYHLTHHYSADQHVSRVSDAMREFYISEGFLDV